MAMYIFAFICPSG